MFVLEVVAVALNVFFVWPQAIRILRTRELAGASPTTWVISLTLFTVWAAYAINENYVSLLVANLSCFAGAATIVIVGCQTGWPKRFLAYAAAGITAAIILSVVSLVALISIPYRQIRWVMVAGRPPSRVTKFVFPIYLHI